MWVYSQDETALYDTNSFTVFYIEQDQEKFKLYGAYNERLIVLGEFSNEKNAKYMLAELGEALAYSKNSGQKVFYIFDDYECSRYQDED